MHGDDTASGSTIYDHHDLDRLSLASPLLGATGWIDGLARLVAIDTGAGGEAGHEFTVVLQDMFAPLGLGFRRHPLPGRGSDGEAALVSVLAGRRTGRKVCTFYFHTHTLPAGGGWTRSPFSLTRQGSRLYGRGTTDMKGAIAAVWAALRAADAVGLGLGFDPVLIFCADPVISHHACLRYLLAEGLIDGHLIYLNGTAAPRVWTESPGMLHLSVTLQSRDAAVPPGGPDVSTPAQWQELLAACEQHLAPGQPSGDETAGGGDPPIVLVRNGTDRGSETVAQDIMIRLSYQPAEDPEDIVREMRQAVQRGLLHHAGIEARVCLVGHGPPVEGAAQGPNGARWRQALSWGFGFQPSEFRIWSGAEMSPMGYVQQAGIQEILLGGLRRHGGGHGIPDEFTTVEDVESLSRAVLAYLSDVEDLPVY